MTISIRAEQAGDAEAIAHVHRDAFPTDAESRLVDALRRAGNLSYSIVAVDDGRFIGHVAFSPVRIDAAQGHAAGLGLAPVAVLPSHQRRGIAAALIRQGLEWCRDAGTPFVVVLGDPAYYPRFGFRPARLLGIDSEYDAGDSFMLVHTQGTGPPLPRGIARYAPQFALVT